MEDFLSTAKVDYVLYHLNHSCNLTREIQDRFEFKKNDLNIGKIKYKIIFNFSDKPLIQDKILWIENVPILFPVGKKEEFYSIDNNNLIFHHDLLKSAFFLLSGYQEYQSDSKDHFNRFPFNCSIQKHIEIIRKPVVNYYFRIVTEGISAFCQMNGISFEKKSIFNNLVFFLTHDIDQIDFYTFKKFLYRIKELTCFVKSDVKPAILAKQVLKNFIELFKFRKKDNPAWSFDYLLDLEKKHHFHSTYFLLEKDQKDKDSLYEYTDIRIRKLIEYLEKENCEIGLHGTVNSAQNYEKLNDILSKLNHISKQKVSGIRQHRLIFNLPLTSLSHEKAGIRYDSSLCFPEHEGFRNSYCLPFKLFDFNKDRMINVWELPLNVMDVTLFYYRKLTKEEACKSVNEILSEIKRFNGIFTLLWHNDFFDEDRYPGISKFYEDLLNMIDIYHPINFTGKEIIDRINNL